MTIKFKQDQKEKVEDLRADYLAAVEEGAEAEVVQEKQAAYMTSFSEMIKDDTIEQAKAEIQKGSDDVNVAIARGQNVLTSEERKFFAELVNPDTETYKEKSILPETIVERVFEDAQASRPLLQRINFRTSGMNTRLILADREGQAVWGEIFGKIQGQIDANFREVNFSQNKLTAFAVVPKDLIKFGPRWVERFVRLQLAEVIGIALEYGVVHGGGATKNEPIGLTKDYDLDEGTIADKEPTGRLTFESNKHTVVQLAKLMTHLSTKQNGKVVNVAGKVVLVVSPADQFMVRAQYTTQTTNGQWITSLPFNIEVVASEQVAQGRVIAYVSDRYEAVNTGNVEIKRYDQTLALEDVDLFITKHFAHGMPADNKASAVYTLEIPDLESVLDQTDDGTAGEV